MNCDCRKQTLCDIIDLTEKDSMLIIIVDESEVAICHVSDWAKELAEYVDSEQYKSLFTYCLYTEISLTKMIKLYG